MVHPSFKEVIPLCPEIIRKQDGTTKNDYERNAINRMLNKLRENHPHMKFIVNEDSLASNTPHIKDLQEHDLRYILGAKEGNHKFLFEFVDLAVETGKVIEVEIPDEKLEGVSHCFRIVYKSPLTNPTGSSADLCRVLGG